jgi:hypothetical protein
VDAATHCADPVSYNETAKLNRCDVVRREHVAVTISFYRQIPLAIEDDVVVDQDATGHDGLRFVAGESVRTTAFRDGIKDTLLGAWELLPYRATGSAVTAHASRTTITARTTVTSRTTIATRAAGASGLTAPNERHQSERADAQESE